MNMNILSEYFSDMFVNERSAVWDLEMHRE